MSGTLLGIGVVLFLFFFSALVVGSIKGEIEYRRKKKKKEELQRIAREQEEERKEKEAREKKEFEEMLRLDREREKEEEAREEARLQALELADVDNMDGISFESYVARLLENEGFSNVQVTQASSDFGVDIIASRDKYTYAIQTKRTETNVSRRAVSDAVAGKKFFSCNAAMVITNSFISKQVKEFALFSGCEIVERDTLAEWIMKFQSAEMQANFKFEADN